MSPRKTLPFVETWTDRHGKKRAYFRRAKGARIALPGVVGSDEFHAAYAAALAGSAAPQRQTVQVDPAGTLGALIASYKASANYIMGLRPTSKLGYNSRLEAIRTAHGHRSVAGLTRERIEEKMLLPYANHPGAAQDTLKKLRVLIKHAISKGLLKADPSAGIKRAKTTPIRAWTETETIAFEKRWPIGTKQRTAYELMVSVGTARVDVHKMTWSQIDIDSVEYTRSKTGIAVDIGLGKNLRKALEAADRSHLTIINTEFGKPFTVDGFSGFMRDAIRAAGLPLSCRPHGLRKTLGRRLADAGATAHDIMAALGHTTLAQAELYTREASRRRGGQRAVTMLDEHRENRNTQTSQKGLGFSAKNGGKSK